MLIASEKFQAPGDAYVARKTFLAMGGMQAARCAQPYGRSDPCKT